jgi:hypothetical protein
MVTNPGGSVEQANDSENYAAVETATAEQSNDPQFAPAKWVLTLKNVPTKRNFQANYALVYNAKGTTNPNANNYLTVVSVSGPTKYVCRGNWPMNI